MKPKRANRDGRKAAALGRNARFVRNLSILSCCKRKSSRRYSLNICEILETTLGLLGEIVGSPGKKFFLRRDREHARTGVQRSEEAVQRLKRRTAKHSIFVHRHSLDYTILLRTGQEFFRKNPWPVPYSPFNERNPYYPPKGRLGTLEM